MPTSTQNLVVALVNKLRLHGLDITEADNQSRLKALESELPRRLPNSFSALLSRYSFPSFAVRGFFLFDWGKDGNSLANEAAAPKGSLSEVLRPAGFVQIGRLDPFNWDAVCFDLNDRRQNRECRIVLIDHEQILCNRKTRVLETLCSSFIDLANRVIKDENLRVEMNWLDLD